ncbi:MAG: hypothetical protein LBI42_02675 [Chitinispirillales bacterium]|jgi:hypothetical protein|nr:hypothetical protein [Chitinispirillales bacterium]
MSQARMVVLNEAQKAYGNSGWTLCFQYCCHAYSDKTVEHGYRFIWRIPATGNLQSARGQARIPSIKDINELTKIAQKRGLGTL